MAVVGVIETEVTVTTLLPLPQPERIPITAITADTVSRSMVAFPSENSLSREHTK